MVLPINKQEETSYRPLSDGGSGNGSGDLPWKKIGFIFLAIVAVGIVVSLARHGGSSVKAPYCGPLQPVMEAAARSAAGRYGSSPEAEAARAAMRGVAEGVSPKSTGPVLAGDGAASFKWNDSALAWQRTAFHFQPEKNWMNDPNGPLFYKGWYHFFYQYNPNGAVWGDIVWGHAVSRDLVRWLHLPLAMIADQWYDVNGVWTGSATILPDGQVIMLYTGATNESVQVQNLAVPADLSDPLLIRWVKHPSNPVLLPPPCVYHKDFRDPTTAWLTSAGRWRLVVGSKVNKTGIVLVYDTDDFLSYDLKGHLLHAVPRTGMWECVDFFPVSTTGDRGLDPSENGDGVRHVLKASMDDDRHDYYAIGTYKESDNSWVPDHPEIDVGIGIRYDYGVFYAAKSFYDQEKQRRVLWGWIGESDSEAADVKRGWASLQGIPRTILLDTKTGSNLLQWPVEEVESLRKKSKEFKDVIVKAGEVEPLDVGNATQLDITAEFELSGKMFDNAAAGDAEFSCRTSGGASQRGSAGPFGILVLADENLVEYTPVYFYVAKGANGSLNTFFCTDQSSSSLASDVGKEVYGDVVPVLKNEKFSMRILVDHSIVESFAQGGRSVITARVYPTRAIYGAARVFVFNNATKGEVKASVKIWQMDSANIHSYTNEYQ